jgi:hypothetical protein
MEVEYVAGPAQPGPSAHLHTRCFLALEQELLRTEARAGNGATLAPASPCMPPPDERPGRMAFS